MAVFHTSSEITTVIDKLQTFNSLILHLLTLLTNGKNLRSHRKMCVITQLFQHHLSLIITAICLTELQASGFVLV